MKVTLVYNNIKYIAPFILPLKEHVNAEKEFEVSWSGIEEIFEQGLENSSVPPAERDLWWVVQRAHPPTDKILFHGRNYNYLAVKKDFLLYRTSCLNWVTIERDSIGNIVIEFQGSSKLIHDSRSLLFKYFWTALQEWNHRYGIYKVDIVSSHAEPSPIISAFQETAQVSAFFSFPIEEYRVDPDDIARREGFGGFIND